MRGLSGTQGCSGSTLGGALPGSTRSRRLRPQQKLIQNSAGIRSSGKGASPWPQARGWKRIGAIHEGCLAAALKEAGSLAGWLGVEAD